MINESKAIHLYGFTAQRKEVWVTNLSAVAVASIIMNSGGQVSQGRLATCCSLTIATIYSLHRQGPRGALPPWTLVLPPWTF